MSEIKLYLGDCLEILPTLPDNSVDAVITDIPYGTTQCKWDEIIPLDEMWEQVKRLTGVFITTASQPFTSVLVTSNLDWFKYGWVWNKKSPSDPMNVKTRPMKQHEDICIFAKNRFIYNPQLRKTVGKPFGRINKRNTTVYGQSEDNFKSEVGYPLSILDYARPNNWSGGGFHPTQKPIKLYEYLIRTYTNEGDTVLDFAMGSGTTGIASVQTVRNFIGIEIEPKYYEIAEKRIAEAQLQIRMPI